MAKFYCETNPFLFIRHESLGVTPRTIQEYHYGIQFINGYYTTEDIETIKGLRKTIDNFLTRDYEPLFVEVTE